MEKLVILPKEGTERITIREDMKELRKMADLLYKHGYTTSYEFISQTLSIRGFDDKKGINLSFHFQQGDCLVVEDSCVYVVSKKKVLKLREDARDKIFTEEEVTKLREIFRGYVEAM